MSLLQVVNQPMVDNVVLKNVEDSASASGDTKGGFGKIFDYGTKLVDDINQSHQFIQSVMSSSSPMTIANLRETMHNLERFSTETGILGKSISIVQKDVDTLTKLQ